MRILRNSDEWVGLLVLVSIGLFVVAVLQAGLLSDWFRSTAKLRIMLPETGSQGLSAGADIQLLGTRVGTIRRVVVDPSQRMYAEGELEEQATGFIRRDSKAVVRKQFGVAGAAFLDISRGKGAQLDWNYAVIDAATERDPTENIGAMIDQVKQKVFPILDDVGADNSCPRRHGGRHVPGPRRYRSIAEERGSDKSVVTDAGQSESRDRTTQCHALGRQGRYGDGQRSRGRARLAASRRRRA